MDASMFNEVGKTVALVLAIIIIVAGLVGFGIAKLFF